MGDGLDAALAAAQRALAVAEDDAAGALELADDRTVGTLQKARLVVPEGRAWWARGLAFRKLGRHEEALDALSRAEQLFTDAGETYEAQRVVIPLAFEKALCGEVDEAVAALESAVHELRGTDAAMATAQLALVLHRAGRDDASVVAWDKAISASQIAKDVRSEARCLLNRGIIRAEWGDFEAAASDLSEAARINESIGDEFEMVNIDHNRGYIAARQGNLASALRYFDESQRRATLLGVQKPEILLDRADALAEAGLLAEARAVVEEAASLLEAMGQRADLAEACLSAARICLAQKQQLQARDWARRARRDFDSQGRLRWIPVASFYENLSESGHSPSDRAPILLELSNDLRSSGWESRSYEADALAVDLLLEAGELKAARKPLDRLRSLQRRGANLDRFLAWMAETRFRMSENRYVAAGRSMDAAVNALLSHQAANGSIELRVQGAGRADEAVELATLLGRAMRSPLRALGWIERIRSSQEPRGMADHAEMARRLEDLRTVTLRLDASPLDPHEQRRLRAKQRALEELVRRYGRYVPGGDNPTFSSTRELVAQLEDRVLIEYIPSGERLAAIILERGCSRYVDLSSIAEVRRAVAGLRMTLVGIVGGQVDPTGDAEARSESPRLLDERLSVLSSLLIDRLDLSDSQGEVVVVPWGAVGSVPWGALPAFRPRPVVVAPSASAWRRSAQCRAANGLLPRRVLVVCGPGLPYSGEEAESVRDIWGPGTRLLESEEATVETVLDALASADLVHFATHASFRSDSPLLSSLQLTDGPLTGYDFSRLKQVPATVVLSCCETGMTDADRPGTFGLCGLLLASGASSIVASVVPVVDESAPHFTIPFHRDLRSHGGISEALVAARKEASYFDYSGLGFCCFGAG